MKNLPAKEGDTRDCRSIHWVEKIPWRRKWQLTPVFLPGKIPWHSLAWPATAHGDRKRVGPTEQSSNEVDETGAHYTE